ncbi:membrane protein insertion efficiency factor YidD [Noviherbaspirillum galbum]|uniref:Putative membrane protein insertion efficiency factor n=1 Tax=Noviherbaspirillum galbum TaxID=2709383 RepID=A0A6B3SX23_9BURK|nr:membrane protein insertion efficiency factor YidD [Noviherbaspirillum galbum]NEX63596.1 membrane protein insertion efficiency factor YidD [Noviherbaspirillum galbum]
MKTLLLWLLKAYQYSISPFLGANCRFYPSCSRYAMDAVNEHGAARGSLLAAKRLCKCHPWHPGGIDPVPQKSPPETARAHDAGQGKACCPH